MSARLEASSRAQASGGWRASKARASRLCAGDRSFGTGHTLCRHVLRRFQEHRCAATGGKPSTPAWSPLGECPGDRPFGAGHALCRHMDGGVFKSTNGGGSWTAIGVWALDFTLCHQRPGHRSFGAGHALRRHDGRRRLQEHQRGGELDGDQRRPDLQLCQLLAIDLSAPATLYAGIDEGGSVFKSTNGGESWTSVNSGLTSPPLCSGDRPFGAGHALRSGIGVFKSTNGGANWKESSLGGRGLFAGDRSFGADDALRRHLSAASSRASMAARIGRTSARASPTRSS